MIVNSQTALARELGYKQSSIISFYVKRGMPYTSKLGREFFDVDKCRCWVEEARKTGQLTLNKEKYGYSTLSVGIDTKAYIANLAEKRGISRNKMLAIIVDFWKSNSEDA